MAVISLISLVAADRAPLRLEPVSSWQLDYSADSCRLIRIFGKGDQKTVFLMERFSPSDYFSLTVAGHPLRSARLLEGRPISIDIRFGPEEAQQSWTVAPASVDKLPGFMVAGVGFVQLTLDPRPGPTSDEIGPTREAAITTLTIGGLARNDLVLELGSMGKPMEAVRSCTDELLTHWGMDLARFATRTKGATAIGNPGNWLRSDDYPRDMLNSGQQGLVHFRLMVGLDGNPTSCHIQRSTRPQEFDDAVCRALLKRAKFTPALDSEGAPFKSYFLSFVRFEISS